MTASVLAIDGGNSKADVVLLDETGEVLASVRGGGVSPRRVGVERCLDTLAELARSARGAAGLSPGPPFARHTSACLVGVDLPREEAELRESVAARGWSDTTTVDNDAFAVLRAGTSCGVGVAVLCGAGINCVGMAADGRVSRFPALGRISGDWGGSAFLAHETLWWAVRAEDGRGPETALRCAVVDHFQLRDIAELVEKLHFGEMSTDALYPLCPLLFEIAASGDPVAARLVGGLVEEVGVLVTVTMRRLGLLDERVEIVLGGGVLAGAGRRFASDIRRRCVESAPRCAVSVVETPSVVGAGLLGLDQLGAADAAFTRLRRWRPARI